MYIIVHNVSMYITDTKCDEQQFCHCNRNY